MYYLSQDNNDPATGSSSNLNQAKNLPISLKKNVLDFEILSLDEIKKRKQKEKATDNDNIDQIIETALPIFVKKRKRSLVEVSISDDSIEIDEITTSDLPKRLKVENVKSKPIRLKRSKTIGINSDAAASNKEEEEDVVMVGACDSSTDDNYKQDLTRMNEAVVSSASNFDNKFLLELDNSKTIKDASVDVETDYDVLKDIDALLS